MAFVLDASVALAWCFPDESSGYAASILDRFREEAAMGPAIWPQEVANALVVGMQRRCITGEQIDIAVGLLKELPIEIDQPVLARTLDAAIRLAVEYNLSVYDASYLELAQRLKRPLATADGRLSQAARALELELV